MDAQGLLDLLLTLQDQGVDLTKVQVKTLSTEYDTACPYDMGTPVEHYPNGAEMEYTGHSHYDYLVIK